MELAPPEKIKGFTPGDATRITRIGSVLRRTKIDELPQLFNVLKGDMSIVGPRPEVEQWTNNYHEKWAIVHSVRPGITDWSAIEYRNEEDILLTSQDPNKTYRDTILPKKLSLYIQYVEDISFLTDMKIIWRTIQSIVDRRT